VNWENETIENIIGGKSSDNISLLKLFLTDYSKKFNKTSLNASCWNCIRDYHKEWINSIKEMENTCKYRLYKKFEGISLGFGSSVCVNNANITDELAQELIKNRGTHLFASLPTQEETIVEPTTDAPQLKKQRRKKQQ